MVDQKNHFAKFSAQRMLEQNFEMESWKTDSSTLIIFRKKGKKEEKKKSEPERKVPRLIPFFPSPHFS